MTGGLTGEFGSSLSSAEVLFHGGAPWCSLPDMPTTRRYHSQTGDILYVTLGDRVTVMSGLMLCGGGFYSDTCLTWQSGDWVTSHNLTTERWYHTSWNTPEGVLLMGGEDFGSNNTTELILNNGSSVEMFKLKYPT